MIVKRLPTVEVIEQPVSDVGVSCDCVDPVFNAPNPDCKYCNGTGIIQALSLIHISEPTRPY